MNISACAAIFALHFAMLLFVCSNAASFIQKRPLGATLTKHAAEPALARGDELLRHDRIVVVEEDQAEAALAVDRDRVAVRLPVRRRFRDRAARTVRQSAAASVVNVRNSRRLGIAMFPGLSRGTLMYAMLRGMRRSRPGVAVTLETP